MKIIKTRLQNKIKDEFLVGNIIIYIENEIRFNYWWVREFKWMNGNPLDIYDLFYSHHYTKLCITDNH